MREKPKSFHFLQSQSSLVVQYVHKGRLVLHSESNTLNAAESGKSFAYTIKNALLVRRDVRARLITLAELTGGGWRDAVGLCSRCVDLPLSDSDADTCCRSRKEIPQESEPLSRYRSCDVGWRVPNANWEDVDIGWRLKNARAERKDGLSVGSSTFWKDSNDLSRIAVQKVLYLSEFGVRGRGSSHGRESCENST